MTTTKTKLSSFDKVTQYADKMEVRYTVLDVDVEVSVPASVVREYHNGGGRDRYTSTYSFGRTTWWERVPGKRLIIDNPEMYSSITADFVDGKFVRTVDTRRRRRASTHGTGTLKDIFATIDVKSPLMQAEYERRDAARRAEQFQHQASLDAQAFRDQRRYHRNVMLKAAAIVGEDKAQELHEAGLIGGSHRAMEAGARVWLSTRKRMFEERAKASS